MARPTGRPKHPLAWHDAWSRISSSALPTRPFQHRCQRRQVSRAIRNAYRTPVSIDPAPAPRLMALSERGAVMMGLPWDAVKASEGAATPPGTPARAGLAEARAATRTARSAGSLPAPDLRRHEPAPFQPTPFQQDLERLAMFLTGTSLAPSCDPYGTCYGGHQFGAWAGQLGDGRVATLGDLRASPGREDGQGGQGDLLEVGSVALLLLFLGLN